MSGTKSKLEIKYYALSEIETLECAWLSALSRITKAQNGEINNLFVNVEKPDTFHTNHKSFVKHINDFQCENNKSELSDISNLYFPSSYKYSVDISHLSQSYLSEYDPKSNPNWGTYFKRMILRKGRDGENINQLQYMIQKLKNEEGRNFFQNVFEIVIFDPRIDNVNGNERPNISMIELKPKKKNGEKKFLDMTVIFREHDYMFCALGDLFGVRKLHKYMSKQTGYRQGSLTILSLCSYVEDRKIARKLIDECTEIIGDIE